MPLLNKDKMMNGFEKAVDALGEGIKDIGQSFKETFTKK